METNTYNIYLFKALDAYPYELETTIESLNYALSYEAENAFALTLMAKVYGYQLQDLETAKHYFELALAANMDVPGIYVDYVNVLIRNDDYEQAQKLIDYAMGVKATDKALLQLLQGHLLEAQMQLKAAKKAFKKAAKLGMNNDFISFANREKERVVNKLPGKNKKKKKKNKSKKRKEKSKGRSK